MTGERTTENERAIKRRGLTEFLGSMLPRVFDVLLMVYHRVDLPLLSALAAVLGGGSGKCGFPDEIKVGEASGPLHVVDALARDDLAVEHAVPDGAEAVAGGLA